MSVKRQDDIDKLVLSSSTAMRSLDKIVRAVAPKDISLMIVGESGAGKEVVARRAHMLSARSDGPFVPINCAAIPDALFESEVFGHEKGAFTGAIEQTRGKVEAAEGGTLFLDEIGEVPLAVQAKLLRFLENRQFMRVGGSTKLKADIRLICATLQPLEQRIAEGRFRPDLFYRVQGVTLHVPPLRDRRADLPLLISAFLVEMARRHDVAEPRLTRAARAALARYQWPGNVRELRNAIETLCVLRPGRVVRVSDLPEALRPASVRTLADGESGTLTVGIDEGLPRIVERVFAVALAAEGGNRSRAASRLGVSVRTMQRFALACGADPTAPERTARTAGQ